MFGVLNRFIARLDAGPEEQNSSTHNAFGFQVLRNTNPDVPLEPWFDFIIGINGRTIDNPDPTLFATEVKNCAGTTINLGVFSAKGLKIREIYIPVLAGAPTLGLSLQWTPLSAAEDVWHILDVIPNSPADHAGLLPYGDYVIGSPEGLVRGESGLVELVEDHLNRPLRLLVYNHEYNVTRPLTITPSRSWGGEGALGCVLGFGALHRIPAPLEEPPQGPGETLFSAPLAHPGAAPPSTTAPFDEKHPLLSAGGGEAPGPTIESGAGFGFAGPGPDLFVPANMAKSPPPIPQMVSPGAVPPSSSSAKRKQRAHHAHAAPGGSGGGAGGGGLDDYFKEGEQKSLEEDYVPKAKSPVPPPPRAGGPPRGAAPPPPKSVTPTPGVDVLDGGEGE